MFSMDSQVFEPHIRNSCFSTLGWRTLIIPRTSLYETNNHDSNNGGQYNRDIPTRRWGQRNQELTSTNQVDQGGVDISLVTPSPLTAYTIQWRRVEIQSRHKMHFFLVYSGDYKRGSSVCHCYKWLVISLSDWKMKSCSKRPIAYPREAARFKRVIWKGI